MSNDPSGNANVTYFQFQSADLANNFKLKSLTANAYDTQSGYAGLYTITGYDGGYSATAKVTLTDSAGSYSINGVAVNRELTVNGNNAEILIAAGKQMTLISRDNTVGLPASYIGDGVFDVQASGNLSLKNVTLRNGVNKIMVAINVQDGGQLEFDGSKLKDFFGENDGNSRSKGNTFGIHSDPGSASQITVTNSEIDESNAFRDVMRHLERFDDGCAGCELDFGSRNRLDSEHQLSVPSGDGGRRHVGIFQLSSGYKQ